VAEPRTAAFAVLLVLTVAGDFQALRL
jgi:hypothetical protein